MTSRERVLKTLGGKRADRVPINVFAGWNPGIRGKVEDRYGRIEAFNSRFGIDIATGVLPRFPYGRRDDVELPENLGDFLGLEQLDPSKVDITGIRCDGDLFPTVEEAVVTSSDRAVFAHAWGVFELSQFLYERDGRPGTEDALLNMIAEKEVCRELYARLGAWTADCVDAAIDAGADVIELSDDWGQQNTMLFSPDLWWDLVFPPTKSIVDRARGREVPVLIHSDGDITLVLDGIRELGIQGLHPVQESAGMDVALVRSELGPHTCLMGGLDTVTALPRMNERQIEQEVERVFGLLKESGAYIFAGSHMFQDDIDLPVLEAAYRTALRLSGF